MMHSRKRLSELNSINETVQVTLLGRSLRLFRVPGEREDTLISASSYPFQHLKMMKMKSTYFVAGLLLMIVQSSWQNPLQETQEKSRSFKDSQAEPLDDSRQLNEVKRHSQGTFTSDYSKFLDRRRAQDFIQWLMSSKRSGQQGLEEREKENLLDQLSSNGLARHHAEYERHADGTYASDISSYLEGQAAKEFIAWLVNGRGRRDSSEGAATAAAIGRRHAEGTFTSDYHQLLDDIATQEFLKWLMNQKVTQRDLTGVYQYDVE